MAIVSSLPTRYHIEAELGAGGMGVVYRAVDRLTQGTVALKSIELFSESDPSYLYEVKLAMGREFEILASMRHPHVINVLDFGFDEQQNPYFTMEFLSSPQNLIAVSAALSVQDKVRLLIKVLQALHYLHRRGIVHLDLKPDNVLMSQGRLRVLDFGLAVLNTSATTGKWTPSGTLFYMAPETLRATVPPGPGADLYAVGVLAYQILTGDVPFSGEGRITKLVQEILEATPDMRGLAPYPDLQAIVQRLLAKSPDDRYANALAVIDALNATLDTQVPLETSEIRESFLQSSEFVGRKQELKQLMDSLEMAISGQGAAWLVGGENGIGKSRLLDELRIQAQVKGVQILYGQGVAEGGGLPFQLWREPLRRLVLKTDMDDLAAGVLKQLIPDIDRLLEREIPPALDLDGPAGEQRLLSTIMHLFAEQRQPMLLILEDLQWVSESLLPLEYLLRVLDTLPLLIVGSYRSDERPDLPVLLPHMQVMRLDRLSKAEIAALSVAMLGQAGQRPDLLELLQRETEGNAFFLVEVMRTLAEQAGYLRTVGQAILPIQVFAGGVEAVIRQRLARVPEDQQPILKLAAVLGRQLDLRVLDYLADGKDISHCLQMCGDIAIFEIRDGNWRFSHEKLREGVLAALVDEERAALHRQVAKAIENIYPHDPNYAASSAHHWHHAGNTIKEQHYAQLAGEHAMAQYANDEAVTYFSRALNLTATTDLAKRYALLSFREQILHLQGKRQAQALDLAVLAEIAEAADNPNWQAEVALRRSKYLVAIDAYDDAVAAAQETVDIAQRIQAQELLAQGELARSTALYTCGDYDNARMHCENAIAILRPLKQTSLLTTALRSLGNILHQQGAFEHEQATLEEALQISDQTGDLQNYGLILSSLYRIAQHHQHDTCLARDYLRRSLRIFRKIGNVAWELKNLNNLGVITRAAGEYDQARAYFEQILPLQCEIGDRGGEGLAQANLGLVAHLLGDYSRAEAHYRQALRVMEALGNKPHAATLRLILGVIFMDTERFVDAHTMISGAIQELHQMGARQVEGEGLEYLGWLAHKTRNFAQAQVHFQRGRELNDEIGQPMFMLASTAGLALSMLEQGNISQTSVYIEEVLALLEQYPKLDGHDFPFRVFLACIEVLQRMDDPRAMDFLTTVHNLLQERAAKISDKDMRRSFLENIAEHREIVLRFRAI